MKRRLVITPALLGVGLLASVVLAHAARLPTPEAVARLAAELGADVDPRRAMIAGQGTQSGIVALPRIGLEEIPATAYREGVIIGAAYVESPAQNIEPAVYLLRAVNGSRRGPQGGRVELVMDAAPDAPVVARLPASVVVASRRVPQNPVIPETRITAHTQLLLDVLVHWVWVICPNGLVICFPIFFGPILF